MEFTNILGGDILGYIVYNDEEAPTAEPTPACGRYLNTRYQETFINTAYQETYLDYKCEDN